MNCEHCEEQLSDYLENALIGSERDRVQDHLRDCNSCSGLLAGMAEIVNLAGTFPVYGAPPWLPTRILANTPRIARETWLDTLTAVSRWVAQPHIAMAFFASTLVLSWMSSLAGISPTHVARVARDPAVLYYEAGTLANRVYTSAIRTYNRVRLVTEIRSQIEQFREIS